MTTVEKIDKLIDYVETSTEAQEFSKASHKIGLTLLILF